MTKHLGPRISHTVSGLAVVGSRWPLAHRLGGAFGASLLSYRRKRFSFARRSAPGQCCMLRSITNSACARQRGRPTDLCKVCALRSRHRAYITRRVPSASDHVQAFSYADQAFRSPLTLTAMAPPTTNALHEAGNEVVATPLFELTTRLSNNSAKETAAAASSSAWPISSRTVDGIDILLILEAIRALMQGRITYTQLIQTQPKVIQAIQQGVKGLSDPTLVSSLSRILSQSWVCSILVEHTQYVLQQSTRPAEAPEKGMRRPPCGGLVASAIERSTSRVHNTRDRSTRLRTGSRASAEYLRRARPRSKQKAGRRKQKSTQVSGGATVNLTATREARIDHMSTKRAGATGTRRSQREPIWNSRALLFWGRA